MSYLYRVSILSDNSLLSLPVSQLFVLTLPIQPAVHTSSAIAAECEKR
jgi:hypothetical protein